MMSAVEADTEKLDHNNINAVIVREIDHPKNLDPIKIDNDTATRSLTSIIYNNNNPKYGM